MKEKHEFIMDQHPEVASWLKDRPLETKRAFAADLMEFSESVGVEPEAWRQLDRFKARDLAWKYIEPMKAQHSAKAIRVMAALKSWYRNLNGEMLPTDSGRGGKHHVKMVRKKATYEVIPTKTQAYELIDLAGNWRDKTVLLLLFQSGIRKNVLKKLTYGIVQKQLTQDIITLKITRDLDIKLRGADIDYYYTFINGEAVLAMRKYCELFHANSKPDTPLFYAKRSKKPINLGWVWKLVRNLAFRGGFVAEVNGTKVNTIWPHSFRKTFRQILTKADIDDNTKEEMLGHRLTGSRESYFDRHDVETIKQQYQKANFSREIPASETAKLRAQLENEQAKRAVDEARLEKLEHELETTRQLLTTMLEQKKG